MLRWRILASSYRSLREFDLILKCAEQTSVLKLIWLCRRRSRYWAIPTITQLVCVVWLTINFTGAITISFLGLYYSSSEQDLSWVFTETGSASVLNLAAMDLATIELSAIEHRHCGRCSTLDLSKNDQDKGCVAADSRICSGRTYNFQDRPITQDRAKDPLLSNSTRRLESRVVFGPSERFIDINTNCNSYKITSEPSGNSTNITPRPHVVPAVQLSTCTTLAASGRVCYLNSIVVRATYPKSLVAAIISQPFNSLMIRQNNLLLQLHSISTVMNPDSAATATMETILRFQILGLGRRTWHMLSTVLSPPKSR